MTIPGSVSNPIRIEFFTTFHVFCSIRPADNQGDLLSRPISVSGVFYCGVSAHYTDAIGRLFAEQLVTPGIIDQDQVFTGIFIDP